MIRCIQKKGKLAVKLIDNELLLGTLECFRDFSCSMEAAMLDSTDTRYLYFFGRIAKQNPAYEMAMSVRLSVCLLRQQFGLAVAFRSVVNEL